MKNIYRILTIIIVLFSSTFTADAKVHTPAHYEYAIRQCFNEDRWEAGKYMLDEARPYYGDMAVFLELDGWYCYHVKDYNHARRYLHNALEEDSSNTHARELMVKVEEETGNYSSAICYINELLEHNAYSKGWWTRKIYLYRQLHDDITADKLLNRLYEIYPDDTTIRKDVAYRYEEKIAVQKKNSDITGQIESAEHLTILQPKNSDNYLILSNLYLQKGETEKALNIANVGAHATNNSDLMKKYVGIQCDNAQYQMAIAFLNSFPKSAATAQLINTVQEEQARYANANDPYTAYGRVYERTHNTESFNYLMNTSISRGYYNDALYYVKDYVKRNGESDSILYKEYVVYKALGNETQATNALLKLYELNPNDKDIGDELSTTYYKKAVEYMAMGEYANAISPLEFVVKNSEDSEMRESAKNRISGCYSELKNYDEALASLSPSDSLYAQKKGNLLALMGKYPEALECIKETKDSVAYGEVAVPYIKNLMDKREYGMAKEMVDTALNYCNNKEIYMYGISSSNILKKDGSKYINDGFNLYSTDEYFVNQYCGLANRNALAYLKNKDYESAMTTADNGLEVRPEDNDLLYTKGLIFEGMHEYDSAYVYQKHYKPSPVETFGFNKKMQGFINKSLKNEITIDYQRARLGIQDIVTANAGISYTRKLNDKNSVTARFNYAGRDDGSTSDEILTQQAPGGVGVQLGLGYSHTFKHDWTASVEGAWATKYFPQWTAKASLSKEFSNDWLVEGHIQYRKIDAYNKIAKVAYDALGTASYVFGGWEHTQPNMWSAGLYANKTVNGNVDLNLGADVLYVNDKVYFNANTKVQYSPIEGSKSRVYATGGFGTAPEITLIDTSMPNSFEKLNTFVGCGGIYTVTQNLALGLEGTWHTMYKQNQVLGVEVTETTSYVNLFYVHAQIFITF